MRNVWISVVFIWGLCIICILRSPVVAANQGEDLTGGEAFFASGFVYRPTPTPPAEDAKFHREAFRVSTGHAAPVAVNAAAAPTKPTATPVPTPALGAQPAHVVAVRIEGVLDIEDPRFYRGSFTLVPPSAAPAATVAEGTPAENPAPAAGYGGMSADSLIPAYSERTPLPIWGKAMYYNPGIMQEVYHYRLDLGQIQPCGECAGYAALLRQGDLNRRIWLEWSDGRIEGPFLVIDVAARHHIGLLLSRGWVVDVDYDTAMRQRMAGPVPVTVLETPSRP